MLLFLPHAPSVLYIIPLPTAFYSYHIISFPFHFAFVPLSPSFKQFLHHPLTVHSFSLPGFYEQYRLFTQMTRLKGYVTAVSVCLWYRQCTNSNVLHCKPVVIHPLHCPVPYLCIFFCMQTYAIFPLFSVMLRNSYSNVVNLHVITWI